MDIAQAVLSELTALPEPQQAEVLAFIRFLKLNLADRKKLGGRFDSALYRARALGEKRGITDQDIDDEITAVRFES